MSNKESFFIVMLQRETHLSFKQAEILVKSIPNKYLDKAIKIYKEYGIYGLNSFTKGLNLIM